MIGICHFCKWTIQSVYSYRNWLSTVFCCNFFFIIFLLWICIKYIFCADGYDSLQIPLVISIIRKVYYIHWWRWYCNRYREFYINNRQKDPWSNSGRIRSHYMRRMLWNFSFSTFTSQSYHCYRCLCHELGSVKAVHIAANNINILLLFLYNLYIKVYITFIYYCRQKWNYIKIVQYVYNIV